MAKREKGRKQKTNGKLVTIEKASKAAAAAAVSVGHSHRCCSQPVLLFRRNEQNVLYSPANMTNTQTQEGEKKFKR